MTLTIAATDRGSAHEDGNSESDIYHYYSYRSEKFFFCTEWSVSERRSRSCMCVLKASSRMCGAVFVTKFSNQSADPTEDKQTSEKVPLTVKIL